MGSVCLRRRLAATLVLGLYWFSLTASIAASQVSKTSPEGPARGQAVSVSTAPVRCVGTVFYMRANTLRLGGWPKLIVSLDVTRADRCAGQFGQPIGRLHGFMVLTRDKLSLRSHLRAGQHSYWLKLCRLARKDCLDVNTVIRWGQPASAP